MSAPADSTRPLSPAAAALLEDFRPGIESTIATAEARGLDDSALLLDPSGSRLVARTWLAMFCAAPYPEIARELDLSGPLPHGQAWALVTTPGNPPELVRLTGASAADAAAPPIVRSEGERPAPGATLGSEALWLFNACRADADEMVLTLATGATAIGDLVALVSDGGWHLIVRRDWAVQGLKLMHPTLAEQIEKSTERTGYWAVVATSRGLEAFVTFPPLPPRPSQPGAPPAN